VADISWFPVSFIYTPCFYEYSWACFLVHIGTLPISLEYILKSGLVGLLATHVFNISKCQQFALQNDCTKGILRKMCFACQPTKSCCERWISAWKSSPSSLLKCETSWYAARNSFSPRGVAAWNLAPGNQDRQEETRELSAPQEVVFW
jgi:hypothetical protein